MSLRRLSVRQELWGAKSPRLAVLYTELAALRLAMDRRGEARDFCAKADSLADKPPVRQRVADIRRRLQA